MELGIVAALSAVVALSVIVELSVVVESGGIDGKLEDNEARLDAMESVDIEVGGRENDEAVVGEFTVELVTLETEDGALDATASKRVRFDKSSVGNIPPVFEQVSMN